jgi:lipoic acid synthetase
MNTVLENVQPPIGKPKWLRVKLPTGKKYTELTWFSRQI